MDKNADKIATYHRKILVWSSTISQNTSSSEHIKHIQFTKTILTSSSQNTQSGTQVVCSQADNKSYMVETQRRDMVAPRWSVHRQTAKCIEKGIYMPSQLLGLLTTLASGALAAFFSFFFSGVFFFLPGVFFFFFFVHVFCFFCFGGVLGPSSSSLPLQHRWYCQLRRFSCTITTR